MLKQLLIVILGLLFFFTGCRTKKINKETNVNINFSITQTQTYCGGASPTEEILKQLNTPKPLINKTFIVRKGSENDVKAPIIKTFTTNNLGETSIGLSPGNYIVTDKERADVELFLHFLETYKEPTENYGKIDVTCLTNWLKSTYLKFEVIENELLHLSFNINQGCEWHVIPCVQYNGPLPPSTPSR